MNPYQEKVPASWGNDALSKHMAFMYHNALRAFDDLGDGYTFLQKIDDIYSSLLDHPDELRARKEIS